MASDVTDRAPTVAPPAASRNVTSLAIGWLLATASLAFCVPTMLAAGARWSWVCELFTHFRVYYVILLLLGAWICVRRRNAGLGVLTAACLTANLLAIAPCFLPTRQSTQPSTPQVRALAANVYYHNHRHVSFIEYVRRESPDILLLFEVNPPWRQSLSALDKDYPYQLIDEQKLGDGIALFSRHEPLTAELHQLGPSNRLTLVATYAYEDQRFTIMATHPYPPISSRCAQIRDEHLQSAAALAAETEGPLLLLGDLNASPWSPIFHTMLNISGLRDTRRGYGLQTTWKGAPLVRIPIDHALASDEIVIHDRRIGPDIGSDHLPVIVDFSVKSRE